MADKWAVEVRITRNGAVHQRFLCELGDLQVIMAGMNAHPVSYEKPVVGPTAITLAIEGWTADMARRGVKERSIAVFVSRVRAAAAGCLWERPEDLTYAGATEWLAGQREAKKWAGVTTDGVVSALRCFSRYCLVSGLLDKDPFANLSRSGETGGPGDRALTLDEVRRVIVVATAASARDRRAKLPRGLYYGFLALTGLRTAEAAACLWGDVDIDGEVPSIWTNPKWAKNGKRQRVVLCSQLLEQLRAWKRRVPAGREDPVFPATPNRHTWIRDRIAAEIPELDGRGRRAAMHGFRKFTASALYEAGVSDAVIARIMRHADSLTQTRYIDPSPVLEAQAVETIPKIFLDAVHDGQTLAFQGLAPRMCRPPIGSTAEMSSNPVAEQHGIGDHAHAKTSTTPTDSLLPSDGSLRNTEPTGSGSRLSSGVVGRSERWASAAGRGRPLGPPRVGHTPDEHGSGQGRVSTGRVLNLLASAAADLAAAVRTLGQLSEVRDGDGSED